MKKDVRSAVLAGALTVSMLLPVYANGKKDSGSAAKETKQAAAAAEAPADNGVVSTVGPDSGTKMEMWTFVDVHQQFYAEMLQEWNKNHPDKQIQIKFTNYPYGDMHNKLTMANQTGTGAPDLCDVEIGQFPNYLKGVVPFVEMNDYIKPYQKDIVQARLDIYSKDGKFYGIPTHVGATVMYYNDELLSKYGIDYKTIKTWDDFEKAGLKLKDATGGKVYMTGVDTGGTDWLWLSMAEHKQDWTDKNGKANIQITGVSDMIKMQQKWVNEGIAIPTPGGQIDTETGFGWVSDEAVAAFPKAMWYMSRFLNYMPEMKGKYALAPCPVFTAGQPRSVGIGGTGTIVSKQSKHAALAAEFICWAKLSKEGTTKIWQTLGFDPCNTSLWTDPAITKDTSNKYIQYFRTNPFDTLDAIKSEIGAIKCVAISGAINEQINLTVLVDCLQQNADVDAELKAAQANIDIDQ